MRTPAQRTLLFSTMTRITTAREYKHQKRIGNQGIASEAIDIQTTHSFNQKSFQTLLATRFDTPLPAR